MSKRIAPCGLGRSWEETSNDPWSQKVVFKPSEQEVERGRKVKIIHVDCLTQPSLSEGQEFFQTVGFQRCS
jgi:hypothetical protein